MHELTLNGVLQLSSQQLAEAKSNPKIVAVEQDSKVYVHQTSVSTQLDAPYQLARLDKASLPLGDTYSYSLDGSGVNIYILDTVQPQRAVYLTACRQAGC